MEYPQAGRCPRRPAVQSPALEGLIIELLPTRSLWGITLPLGQAVPRLAAEGFAAIEAPLPLLTAEAREELLRLAPRHGLGILPLITTSGGSVDEHLASFRAGIAEALACTPIRINVHSGHDGWSHAEAVRFYREARRIEADCPVQVCHETHRGRVFFSPWRTRDVLDEVDGLLLTADFSHWVCVAERRVLDDRREQDLLHTVAERVRHIHARVGHAQGPQVGDPRLAEFREDLAAHERWWDVVWERMEAQGCALCTMTPEFGPPPYLPTIPATGVPVADLWEICTWQMRRQRERFRARRQGTASAPTPSACSA